MLVLEGQVLQFAVGLVQPQAMCNGGVDVQGFRGNTVPLAARHIAHGAHVVGTVGQLDEDDAYILGHGQQHFAKRLCLALFAGVEVQLVQLGQPVDEVCHRFPETLHQILLGDAAVFHGIVQQGSHERGGVELPVRTDGGDSNRVGDVGITTAAPLVGVCLVCVLPCLAHQLDVSRWQIGQVAQHALKVRSGNASRSFQALLKRCVRR